jgi:CHAT domain-containing protein
MYERLYPKQDHPYLSSSLHNMGLALCSLGEPRKALPHFERALMVDRTDLDRIVADASESEALAYAGKQPLTRDHLLSLTRSLPDKQDVAYASVWASKAALSRILQLRHDLALAAREPKTLDAWQQLADARRQLAFTLRQRAEGKAGLDAEVDRLTKLKEQRESELTALLPALKLQQERDRLRPAQMAEALPGGAAFVDLVRYTAVEFDPKKPGKDGQKRTPSYVAFILVKGREPKRIELDAARPIDAAVAEWLRALDAYDPGEKLDTQRQKLARADERGRELRRLVWDKLAEHLPADTKLVYLSPDGDLARIPWAALPDDKGDGILLDRYLLGVAPYGPFLLDRLLHPADKKDDTVGRLLSVGGINYGEGSRYAALMGSAREADQVTARTGKHPSTNLAGSDATTARLLKELPQSRYAHLATHGFFDEKHLSEERQRLAKQFQDFRLNYQFDQNRTTQFGGQALRSPLAYTGLVLAGANTPDKAGSDGGILSGEAIVELPLEGLRLCVLSACETGLGTLTRDEGVQGLVRAFHLAGCRDVVASLWKVDDAATAALMARFYAELWDNGRSPLEALASAQRFVSRRPDLIPDLAGLRGAASADKAVQTPLAEAPPKPAEGVRRLPPKYWAAFQLYGAGR